MPNKVKQKQQQLSRRISTKTSSACHGLLKLSRKLFFFESFLKDQCVEKMTNSQPIKNSLIEVEKYDVAEFKAFVAPLRHHNFRLHLKREENPLISHQDRVRQATLT